MCVGGDFKLGKVVLRIFEMFFKVLFAFSAWIRSVINSEFLVVEGFGLNISQGKIIFPLKIGSFLSYYNFHYWFLGRKLYFYEECHWQTWTPGTFFEHPGCEQLGRFENYFREKFLFFELMEVRCEILKKVHASEF